MNSLWTPPSVTGTVQFKVTVWSNEVELGHWVCLGEETGIVSHGTTKEEALQRSGKLHQMAVRRMKRAGPLALVRFMNNRNIEFDVEWGTSTDVLPLDGPPAQPRVRIGLAA